MLFIGYLNSTLEQFCKHLCSVMYHIQESLNSNIIVILENHIHEATRNFIASFKDEVKRDDNLAYFVKHITPEAG